MGAGSVERIALAIDTTKDTAALQQAIAEVQVARQVAFEATQAVAAGSRQQEVAAVRAAIAEKETATAVRTKTAAVRAAGTETLSASELARRALEEERAAIAKGIQLLALKGQLTDAASADAVAAWRQEAGALQEAARAAKVNEETYLRLALAVKGFEARVTAAGAAQQRAAQQAAAATERQAAAQQQANAAVAGLPVNRLQQGAQQLNAVAFAAQGAALGGKEAIAQLGNLATTVGLAGSAGNAAFAKMALGIGAGVTLLGTFIALATQAYQKWKALPVGSVSDLDQMRLALLGTVAEVDAALARARRERDQLSAAVGERGDDKTLQAAENKRVFVEQLERRRVELVREEKEEAKETAKAAAERTRAIREGADAMAEQLRRETRLGQLAAETARAGAESLDSRVLREKVVAGQAYQARLEEIRQLFEKRDEEGRLVPLTEKQIEQRRALVRAAEQLRDVTMTRIDAERAAAEREATRDTQRSIAQLDPISAGGDSQIKLDQIEREKQARIDAGVAVEVANREAELKRRAMYEDSYRRIASTAARTSQLLINSKRGELREIGKALQVATRLQQAHEAWQSLKRARYYAAEGLGLLAQQKYPLAALAFASSLEHAANAAESGVGAAGGAAQRGGGGGGSGSDIAGPTFTPNSSGGGQQVIVNLITRDPYGREAIAQTIYETDRAQVLKVPIPTTSGVSVLGRA